MRKTNKTAVAPIQDLSTIPVKCKIVAEEVFLRSATSGQTSTDEYEVTADCFTVSLNRPSRQGPDFEFRIMSGSLLRGLRTKMTQLARQTTSGLARKSAVATIPADVAKLIATAAAERQRNAIDARRDALVDKIEKLRQELAEHDKNYKSEIECIDRNLAAVLKSKKSFTANMNH